MVQCYWKTDSSCRQVENVQPLGYWQKASFFPYSDPAWSFSVLYPEKLEGLYTSYMQTCRNTTSGIIQLATFFLLIGSGNILGVGLRWLGHLLRMPPLVSDRIVGHLFTMERERIYISNKKC